MIGHGPNDPSAHSFVSRFRQARAVHLFELRIEFCYPAADELNLIDYETGCICSMLFQTVG